MDKTEMETGGGRGRALFRGLYYGAGMLILALGLVLNTKSGLGVSAIISVPYSISLIWNLNFGNMTLVIYVLFVIVQFILRGRSSKATDLLQIPLAIVFTRVLNIFGAWLPLHFELFWQNFLLLLLAVTLTGIGAAMTVDMRLVPNPGDGIVQALSDKSGLELGLTKNIFDVFNIAITLTISFVFAGHLMGVGIGTVVSVIGVGRVIAAFNYLFKRPMCRMAGVAA